MLMAPSSAAPSSIATRNRGRAPRRRLLECLDPTALGIDTRHDVLDRPVFAGRVHRLEHDQERVRAVRPEQLLCCGEFVDELSEVSSATFLRFSPCLSLSWEPSQSDATCLVLRASSQRIHPA